MNSRLFLFTLAALVSFSSSAHAAYGTQGRLERHIEFTVDDNGVSVDAVSLRRDKLKGTTKTQGDFNLSNRVSLEVEGVAIQGVHTIEGLESETDVVEYKDGEDGVVHTRPGNHKPGKIQVVKDWSNTSEFYRWRKAVLDGKVDRKSVSVIFHNDAGEEVGRIDAIGCYPTDAATSESPGERGKVERKEIVNLDCLSLALKSKHDSAMASIQNTR